MDWFSSLSAPSHSALSATLAGFAITALTLILVPFSTITAAGVGPTDGSTAWTALALRARWLTVRLLILAFALLTVAAVEWGVVAGYGPVDEIAPLVCAASGVLPDCAGNRLMQVGYAAAVPIMVMGAMALLAALSELVLLTFQRNHDPGACQPGPCEVFRVARFVRFGYGILLALAIWEIAIGAAEILASWAGGSRDDQVVFVPFALAAGSAITYVVVSILRNYGVSRTCSGNGDPDSENLRWALIRQRFVTLTFVAAALLAAGGFAAAPEPPACVAVSKAVEVAGPKASDGSATIAESVSECVVWGQYSESSADRLVWSEGAVVVASGLSLAALVFLGLLLGSAVPGDGWRWVKASAS